MKKVNLNVHDNNAILECFECEVSPKGAVIVCPGGGYSFLSPREAEPVAKAFNRLGYHAFVLYYNVEKEVLGDIPIGQLSDAVCYVRRHCKEFDLQEKKVFVCGFSAGGHLAGSLGILWNHPEYFRADVDLRLHRPDAMILCYPVITAGEAAHRGSMVRLAGEDMEAQTRYSLERFVDQETVPAFIWGTAEDDAVPVANSLLLLQKMTEFGIPVEYHLYPFGVHGLSLATEEVQQPDKNRIPNTHIGRWIEECGKWMDEIVVAEAQSMVK